jgi:hypothetical protein
MCRHVVYRVLALYVSDNMLSYRLETHAERQVQTVSEQVSSLMPLIFARRSCTAAVLMRSTTDLLLFSRHKDFCRRVFRTSPPINYKYSSILYTMIVAFSRFPPF